MQRVARLVVTSLTTKLRRSLVFGVLFIPVLASGQTAGTGSVAISGAVQGIWQCESGPNAGKAQKLTVSPNQPCCNCIRFYDRGSVSITVNGFTRSVSYSYGSTATSIAQNLVNAFNGAGSSSPVNASLSGSTVVLTAKTTGAATNYPLSTSVTYDDVDFASPSFSATRSGPTLTGGTDGTAPTGATLTSMVADANGLGWTLNWTVGGSSRTGQSLGWCSGANCSGWTYISVGVNDTSYHFTSASPGTSYSAYIWTYNSVGGHDPTNGHLTVVTPSAPTGATLTAMVVDANGLGWTLNWTVGGANRTGQSLGWCSGVNCNNWAYVGVGVNDTSYHFANASPDSSYSAYIWTYNAVGGHDPTNGTLTVVTPLAPPSILGISPAIGPVGTPVTIAGTNFGATQGSSTVMFNGTAAVPSSWSNTEIVVPVPSGATRGAVSVSTSGGQTAGDTFTVTDGQGTLVEGQTLTTYYQYNSLDKLVGVQQNGSDSSKVRQRTFDYDWTGRLIDETTPEAGTVVYSYDSSGTHKLDLMSKTTARQIVTHYGYDDLHRLTSKTYEDKSIPPTIYPPVSYTYDESTSNTLPTGAAIGHRTGMTDESGATGWAYDAMGRIVKQRQTVTYGTAPTQQFTADVETDYYDDGSIESITYPSGRKVNYTVDSMGWTSTVVDSDNTTYVTGPKQGVAYTAAGMIDTATFGPNLGFAGITRQNTYNSRNQPLVSSTYTSQSTVQSFSYDFNEGWNNGNVKQIRNNIDPARTQNFVYDGLNRISKAYTDGNVWGNTYQVDAWGNLNKIMPYSTKPVLAYLDQLANEKNQFIGYCYDVSGNLSGETNCNQYQYDGENRLRNAAGATYIYDGDGNRVIKASNGLKVYWRGGGSQLLSEGDLSGSFSTEYVYLSGTRIARWDVSPHSLHYYFSDHLGSATLVTNAPQSNSDPLQIQDQSDYLPFGHEYVLVNSDPNAYKYTGKERDSETQFDYFGARYYSSTAGRFTTPDPKSATERHVLNPQKWNEYTYVLNNPLLRVDPDGLDDYVVFRYALDPKTLQDMLGGRNADKWAAVKKAIESTKDSQGRQNTFHLMEGPDASVENWRKAINTRDTHVIFVGHAAENLKGETIGIMLNNGVSRGALGSSITKVQPNEPNPLVISNNDSDPVSAKSVALFGCNTYVLGVQYPVIDFAGAQSGRNGVDLSTLDNAALGWAFSFGGQAGVNAGNGAIEGSEIEGDTGANIEWDHNDKEPE